jgi:hypothetical protein
VVVQVGDQIDSCRRYNGINNCNSPNEFELDAPDDISILYFLTELHKQASKNGGAVYSLIGNHEIMNVIGDMSYVSHNNLKQFTNYNHKGKIIKDGMEGRKKAFEPGNNIANFLACTRKIALIIGSNLFVHGGIIPDLINKYKMHNSDGIDKINQILTLFLLNELDNPKHFMDLFLHGKISPLWTRMFGKEIINNDTCNKLLQPLKEIYKVGRIYVGHTPQLKFGISSQCDERVWRTDIGMSYAFENISSHAHNRDAQVLEILNDGEKINILK